MIALNYAFSSFLQSFMQLNVSLYFYFYFIFHLIFLFYFSSNIFILFSYFYFIFICNFYFIFQNLQNSISDNSSNTKTADNNDCDSDVTTKLSSRYLCNSPAAKSFIPPVPLSRFSLSPANLLSSQAILVEQLSCIPLWGLTAKGIYQAMCVQTLAISITPPSSSSSDSTVSKRTRTFHFHIRKADGSEEGEETNSASPGFLSLDFRDFIRTLAMWVHIYFPSRIYIFVSAVLFLFYSSVFHDIPIYHQCLLFLTRRYFAVVFCSKGSKGRGVTITKKYINIKMHLDLIASSSCMHATWYYY